MSVINRMLADLEERGAPAARAPGALHAPPARPRRRRGARRVLAPALLAALAGVAAALWWQRAGPPPPVDLVLRAPAPESTSSAQPAPARASEPELATAAPVASAETAVAGAPTDRAEASAPSSVVRTDRYSLRLEDVLADTPPSAWRDAERTVVPGTQEAVERSPPLERSAERTPRAVEGSTGSRATRPESTSAPVPESTQPRAARAANATRPASPPPARVDEAVVRKEDHSPPEVRARRRYQSARSALAQGDAAAARTELRAALARDAAMHPARELLVALLRRGGRDAEARELLARGVAIAPAHVPFALPYARLLVDAGDLERAARVLADVRSSAEGDAEYHALAAAVAQRRDRHDEAIAEYTRALERGGDRGRLWLGLGISLAADGREDDARRAYRAALDAGTLPRELAEWARGRIGATAPPPGG